MSLRRRLTNQRGFTLVETLAATTMMIGVTGATLTTLTGFEGTTRNNGIQNDAQQEARRALGEITRELRNLASPTNELPQAVEKAEGGDIVFLSVGEVRPGGSLNERNTRRVRYCHDSAARVLWRQEQTWTTAAPPAAPPTTACPTPPSSGNWTAATAAAIHVSNAARPVFTYNSSQLASINEVRAKLYVDADPAARPLETSLETVAFLRNQNRAPTASFSAAPSGAQILLNGSQSSDPEGRALEYYWYDNGGPSPVGEGIVLTYAPSQYGNHSITLKVRDPAGLEHAAAAQTVCIVGGTETCQ